MAARANRPGGERSFRVRYYLAVSRPIQRVRRPDLEEILDTARVISGVNSGTYRVLEAGLKMRTPSRQVRLRLERNVLI